MTMLHVCVLVVGLFWGGSVAAQELPLFDTHLHYSQSAWVTISLA